jgi:hypothetical protein
VAISTFCYPSAFQRKLVYLFSWKVEILLLTYGSLVVSRRSGDAINEYFVHVAAETCCILV